MIDFIFITNDPELAEFAEQCGVQRIFVDLERIGKVERQGHIDTLISQHSMSDIKPIKSRLRSADLLVRLNPYYDGSKDEVDQAIEAGADTLILPMFRTVGEVREFCGLVNGRAGVMPLVETRDALQALDDVLSVEGVTEVYLGLNDLHLDMGKAFLFEPLADGLVDKFAATAKRAGVSFGFGGIARVGEGVVTGKQVLGEHLRLGSSNVILSRTFHRRSEVISELKANIDLKAELVKLMQAARQLDERSLAEIESDHDRFVLNVRRFIERKNEKNI